MSKEFMVNGPLSFYEDRDSEKELEPPFELEAVEAGETVDRTVYVQNNIGYTVDILDFEVVDSDGEVRVKEKPESVSPSRRSRIVLTVSPDTVRLEPVEFRLKGDYRFKTD